MIAPPPDRRCGGDRRACPRPGRDRRAPLTPAQARLGALLAAGHTVADAARVLGVSYHTAKAQVARAGDRLPGDGPPAARLRAHCADPCTDQRTPSSAA